MRVKEDYNQKQFFNYSISGIKACKTFFVFVYDLSLKKLQRLQNCLKNNSSFTQNWGSHNSLQEGVYDLLEVYLNNQLSLWAMPNPSSQGSELCLLSTFSWKKIYQDFNENYKACFNVSSETEVIISWTCFLNYYTNRFNLVKKLSRKTDYCNYCCRLHIELESTYGVP